MYTSFNFFKLIVFQNRKDSTVKYFILGMAGLVLIGQIAVLIFYLVLNNDTGGQENPAVLIDQEVPVTREPPPLYAEDRIDYSLQNEELNITFDKGKRWIAVPIKKEDLFDGEYSGSQQELIKNSYVLTEKHVAFLYSNGKSTENTQIKLMYSNDQGKSWQDSIVKNGYPSIRFRKVDFLNDQFGYVIISGDRTMSQEMSSVYLTHDGGKSWRETNRPTATRLIVDGGFVDERTGFLSFGILNPEKPELYITQDAGDMWREAEIRIPEKYKGIFVIAEIPIKEGSQLSMLVNQGPNGDYKGGKVKGKFLSTDNGQTWEFSTEVQTN